MVASMAVGPRVNADRRFFTGMALAMAAAVFVGFAPTYFLAAFNEAPRPQLTANIHIHGALCAAWILLLAVQTGLIAARRPDVHRLMGTVGVVLGAAILVMGFIVATGAGRRVHTAANAGTLADPYVFLMFPLAAVSLFAMFAGLGVAYRRRPEIHKRLMLLATMSLIGPALARISSRMMLAVSDPGTAFVSVPGAIGGLVLINLFLAALVIYDLKTRGRLHPATLWGGGFLLLSEPLRIMIAHSQPWQHLARALMS